MSLMSLKFSSDSKSTASVSGQTLMRQPTRTKKEKKRKEPPAHRNRGPP